MTQWWVAMFDRVAILGGEIFMSFWLIYENLPDDPE